MKIRFVISVILLGMILSACSFSLAEDITPPPGYVSPTPPPTVGPLYPSVPPNPARGAVIFAGQCVSCHGDKGLGNGPLAAGLPVPVAAIGLADISRQYTPSEWFTVISQGKMDRSMPPFASLTSTERWDVLSYVYMLSTTPDELTRGAAVFAGNCAACHGPQGNANPAANFTNQQFMAQMTGTGIYRTVTEGITPDMPTFAAKLTEADIHAVAAYLRLLTFDMIAPTATPEPSAIPTLASTEMTPVTVIPEATVTAGTTTPFIDLSATPAADLTATPEGTGTVSGIITSGSGSPLPVDLTITLHGFDNSQETVTLNAPVQADGSYVFASVPMTPGTIFIVSVEFSGASYSSDVATYDGTTSTFDLPVTVYDTSTDASVLSVDRMHIFFDFSSPEVVQVIELFIFSNLTDKAIVAAESGLPVATFVLPAGYQNLQFQDGSLGSRYVQTKSGFGDTMGIVPGSGAYQMIFAFELPYTKKLEFSQPVNYPVAAVLALVPQGVKVRGDQLTDGGSRDVQGMAYQMYTAENIASGDELTMTVTGKPQSASAVSTNSRTGLNIGLGGFGIVLILAAVYLFFRDRARAEEEGEEETEADALGDDADSLKDAIIVLDDQFKAGGIAREAYEKRRAELIARLKALL